MSARNGDKARFHRQRIAKIKRRMKMREERAAAESTPPKRSAATD